MKFWKLEHAGVTVHVCERGGGKRGCMFSTEKGNTLTVS